MQRYYLRRNDKEECWELMIRDAISDDSQKEDALLARFYDGSMHGSPLAQMVRDLLNIVSANV